MGKKILGLDIRPNAISAVLLSSGIRENEVEDFIHIPLPPSETSEMAGKDMTAALTRIREKLDVTGAACAASFPAEEVSYRNIRVPFKGVKKISQILPFELEPLLPFPVQDLVIDFQPISPPEPGDQTDVLAMTAQKSSLAAYLENLKSNGIDPQTVRAGGYATALCMVREMPDNGMLLNLWGNRGTLFLIASGQIRFARTFRLRSDAPVPVSLNQNIRQTLAAFENAYARDFTPDILYLTGYGPDTPMAEELAERLALPVHHLNLVSTLSTRIRTGPDWPPHELDNALALAITESEGRNSLNFRKGPFAKRKRWAVYRKGLIRGGIFSGIVLSLFLLNIFIDSHLMEKEAARLDRQIRAIFQSTFPEVRRIVDPVHQMRVAIGEIRKETLSSGDTPDIRVIDMLNGLSQRITDKTDVAFTRLVMTSDNVLISGNTDTFNSVDDIQNRLEGMPLLKKVDIVSTEIDNKTNRVRFKMKLDL